MALASETIRIGMGATLLPDDYEALSQSDRDILPDPYALCLTSCIAKTARTLHRAGMTEPVDYVFESGDAGQGTTKLILEELFANPIKLKRFAFRSLSFEPKAKFPGLQLADIFAWEAGRYVPLALGWDTSPERKSFLGLRKGNPHTAMLFDSAELTKLAAARRKDLPPEGGPSQARSGS